MAGERKETLHDYLRWWGGITLSERKFNDIDSLILCELSYLDLSKIVKEEDSTTLFEAYQDIVAQNAYSLETAAGGEQDFVEKAAYSARFGNLRISHYVDILEPDITQFSAMVFDLDDKTSFIAFRGTDKSIIGWKEDFMISFKRTPAQEAALRYVNTVMEPGRKYYIGGHSKGGNLAVFAAARMTEAQRRNILRIYDLDGPGFAPEVFDMGRIRAVYPMITRILPAYDVIGQLFFENIPDTRYVFSTNKGILQHDLISWSIDGPHLSNAAVLDPACSFTNEMFRAWINSVSVDRREAFVNEFFDSMRINGAETMEEVTQQGTKTLGEMIKVFVTGNPDALIAALALPVSAVNTAKDMWGDKVREYKDKVQEYREERAARKAEESEG